MREVKDIADWLGYEVIDVEGESVLRYRQQSGKWCEREQRATAAEVHLYDAVRGLVATGGVGGEVWAVFAQTLGAAPDATVQQLLEAIAQLHTDNRHWREKAVGCDEELLAARREKEERLQLVEQLKADRYVAHQLSSAAYYRNQGEQNAFTIVLDALRLGRSPL